MKSQLNELVEDLRDYEVRFPELQRELLEKFGDEGNDIGDAAGILELIVNTMDIEQWADGNQPHDSYTIDEMIEATAEFYGTSKETFSDTVAAVCTLNVGDYKRVHDELY